jgi:hypothetical protein
MFVANCTLAQGSVGRIPALPGKRSICGVSCRRRPWALTHSTRLELDPRLIVGAPGQLVPRADGLGERTAGSGSNGRVSAPTTKTASQHESQSGCMMPPLALQPEFRPKPQDTPTRLLAREASKLRQTEFYSVGPVFCLRTDEALLTRGFSLRGDPSIGARDS